MKKIITVIGLIILSFVGIAQAPAITFTQVASGLTNPIDIVNCGDSRLFIAEKSGKIKIFQSGVIQATPLIDIATLINANGEYGLLSIVFDPNYLTNGFLYCYYIKNVSGVTVEIRRFTSSSPATNTAININTGVIIATFPAPDGSSLHNGGKMNFSPDGYLFVGLGDGSQGQDPSNNAQNASVKFGKMLRIDVNTGGFPQVIWNKGVRNPWRWSFDRLNGDVWIGDVGEGNWEEVDYTPYASSQNLNYGWRCYEGTHTYNTSGCSGASSYYMPMHEYDHTFGSSITGGYVYRGSEYPSLLGYYICADFIKSGAWLIKSNGSGGWIKTSQTVGVPNFIVGFGESNTGELYALKYTSGLVYKISAPPIVPITLEFFGGQSFSGYNKLTWKVATEQNVFYYEIEASNDGTFYTPVGLVPSNNVSPSTYTFKHLVVGYWLKTFYRLKVVDKDGKISYSNIISLDGKGSDVRVYPTMVSDNVTISSGQLIEKAMLYSTDGKLLFLKNLNQSGTVNMTIPKFTSGFYILSIKTDNQTVNQRLFIRN